jgi:hypothetical protein
MANKDEFDLVMVSNESETDSNPRKRQGHDRAVQIVYTKSTVQSDTYHSCVSCRQKMSIAKVANHHFFS